MIKQHIDLLDNIVKGEIKHKKAKKNPMHSMESVKGQRDTVREKHDEKYISLLFDCEPSENTIKKAKVHPGKQRPKMKIKAQRSELRMSTDPR